MIARFCFAGISLSLIAVMAGCGGPEGPAIAPVTGVVTLKGEPVEGAEVTFIPQSGRPSVGVTDKKGKYTLQYAGNRQGAVLGKHKVTISTRRQGVEGEGSQPSVEPRPETIPARYNVATELEVEVESGSNEFDFQLKEGPLPTGDSEESARVPDA